MSTPASNWSYTSTPAPVQKGKAVQALTIGRATAGSLALHHVPSVTIPANLYYFKAYGGAGASATGTVDFSDVDVAESTTAYNPSTSSFTAPVAGLYKFTARIVAGTSSTTAVLVRRSGGVDLQVGSCVIPTSGHSATVSTEVFLAPGDVVRVTCTAGTVSAVNYASFTLASLASTAPTSTFEGRLVFGTSA